MTRTSESGPQVRIGSPGDADALVPLVAAFFAEEGIDTVEARWRINLAAMLADPRSCLLVAEVDGTPVGVARPGNAGQEAAHGLAHLLPNGIWTIEAPEPE